MKHSLLCFLIFLCAALAGAAAAFDLSASSYLGGSGSTDRVTGAVIQGDGTIVLAANLDNAVPLAQQTRILGTGGNAAIVRLSADGRSVLSVSRLADVVHDLSADAAGNLYVAADDFGLMKLNPEADTILWTQLAGSTVWRVDAGDDGHCVALVPGSVSDNQPGQGTVHVFAADGTPVSSFGGSGNTLDVALDSRTQTVVYTGWYNFLTYNGPYSRSYNGGTVTPVDVPYTHGTPYNYGQPGVARKWTVHGWSSTVWTDKAARIPNPRWINAPFSTDPSNLYTQAEIDALESAESAPDGTYQYLLDNPKTFSNNMADTRSYRVAIGGDGQLYIGYEADGGNTPLRCNGLDLAAGAPWTVSDGFFDVFYATSTVPKLVVSAYELRSSSVEWLRSFGFTCRASTRPDGSSDNTITMNGGALEADADGRVYLTGQSYYGQYLPLNTSASFSIPRSGEIAFDPLEASGSFYLGGSYLMVYSPDFRTRLYSTRVAGGQGRAVAARLLDTNETASFAWGGYTSPTPSADVNKVHTRNAVQESRLGTDTGTDGWFAVVQGAPAEIRALGTVATLQDPAVPVVLDGSRSFSRSGHITSWQWINLADGRLLSRDEIASVALPEGAYTVRLTVTDSLSQTDSTEFSLAVTSGDPLVLPAFESSPPLEGVTGWPYNYPMAVSTGPATTFTSVSGAPAGLILTDNGDGSATLAGEPTESGVFRVILSAQANGHEAGQSYLLTIFDGGKGGTLLDDDFTVNSTNSWNFSMASGASGNPYMRWLNSGIAGYAGSGLLNARGYHQLASSTQSVAFHRIFAFRENISDATLSTTGIHRKNTSHPIVRALVGYDTGSGLQFVVSDQPIHTTSAGTAPVAPVPGSWEMNAFTWKSIDLEDLNAGPGAPVPAAAVLENARAIGVSQLQLTGAWLADSFVQVDSLTLLSHRDVLPDKPPAFTSLPATGAASGEVYSYAVAVDDPGALPVTVTANGPLPAWLSLSGPAGSPTLSGTPTADDTGPHTVALLATNSAGAQAWQSFQIQVAAPAAPSFSVTPGNTAIMGMDYLGAIRAHSILGDPSLSLSATGLPGWLTLADLGNGVGRLTGTAPGATASYPITLTASDGVRASDYTFTLAVENPPANQPPVAVITTSSTEGTTPFTLDLSGAASIDSDGTIVALEWESGDGSTGSGLSVQFVYTSAGSYTVRLRLTDDDGAIAESSVNVVVRDPGTLGGVLFSDDFATDTVSQWNTRGIDALGRTVAFPWAASGVSGYDTSALTAPGVIRSVNPHSVDTTTITEMIWKSIPQTDIRGGAIKSDGIHSNRAPTASGFIVEYDDAGTIRWAISSTPATTSTGATATATAGSWNIDTLTWRELDWIAPESGAGIPVPAATVLSNVTGFGVINQLTGAWLKDRGIQMASLALHGAPAPFPEVSSTPPAAPVITGTEFSYLLAATDPTGYAITWSSADPLPEWLSLENTGAGMALLSGTPPAGTTGPLTLRLLATTAEAGPAWHTFTLTFEEGGITDPHPPGFAPALSIVGANLNVEWFGYSGYSYQIEESDDLDGWGPIGPVYSGADAIQAHEVLVPVPGARFFRIAYTQQ